MTQTDSYAIAPRSGGVHVGYVRVSTIAQTLDQQNAALAKAGVAKTFSDTMSGARDDRPGLAELMAYVRQGDTVRASRARKRRGALNTKQDTKDAGKL
jgi:DNA invertase Pin-like site-specific DNA recombinase